jgi:hypothetical protein
LIGNLVAQTPKRSGQVADANAGVIGIVLAVG